MKLEELINEHRHLLNQTDLQIWQFIYNNKEKCKKMSIYEIADQCCVSRTTILRFAKKISLGGYSELKAILKMETNTHKEEKVDEVKALLSLYKRVAEEMAEKDFNSVCRLIYNSNRIIGYGSGFVQKNVVNEIKRLFVNGGELIYILEGNAEFNLLSNSLSKDDLFIIVSLDGESEQVIKIARELKLRSVPFISITRLKDNTLASLSTEKIYITPYQFNLLEDASIPPYESLIIYYLVIEIMYVKYEKFKLEQIRLEKDLKPRA
jgi:RpiR family glv operon transcriptional regulator